MVIIIGSDHDTFHVVIESPRGSSLKLKYMAHREPMGISRPLPAGLVFPFDWGFIPSTCGPDGDPIDACVIWDVASFPGVVIVCRTIGVLNAEQNAANFEQIIPALVIIQANVRTPAFHTSCS